jgi:hypothetical protein
MWWSTRAKLALAVTDSPTHDMVILMVILVLLAAASIMRR